MNKSEQYQFKKAEEVISHFNSSEHGLSAKDIKKRIEESGYNELPEAKVDSYFSIFLSQFKSPLIYVLLFAGIVVLMMKDIIDALFIFFVLLFNATVGTFQEGKAQNTFLALKKFIKGKATVLRDSEEIIISDREVVPGDIIVLREGEKVPADARVIFSNSLKVNESALTGESVPKFKTTEPITENENSIMNSENMLYKGTVVVSGKGRAIVVSTGVNTFLGKIAEETLGIDAEFPLKNDIRKLSTFVIIFISVISAFIFAFEVYNGSSIANIFKTVVAIAVSTIPAGLPIVITIVLASGVWRMSKKNVLVKKLQAVEVLGETKILAVDKTGTVTKNELVVESIYVGGNKFELESDGYAPVGEVKYDGKIVDPLNHPELLLAGKLSALNSSANLIFEKKKKLWRIAGDPTEGAISVFSKKIGFHRDDILSEAPLIDEIPFDYELKYHASLHKQETNNLLIVTGSPEVILDMCNKQWLDGKHTDLNEEEKKRIHQIMVEMLSEGLRVIGFASIETKQHNLDKENIPKLVFGGLFGIKDALRAEVRNAVKQVTKSGIKVVMITGDHEVTAQAIARDAGIYKKGDGALSGMEIRELSDAQLASKIAKVTVFARITPDQKLRIIKAYKDSGQVIAMTGDGVNDALSLTAADIGIGMGKIGTEVAKEASDLILLDDNFANITHGVEEGRNIFSTIKKVVLYLFSTSLGEVLVILGALLLGFPLPLLAAQILWLNLVTDGFLDMALALESKEKRKDSSYVKTYIVDKLMVVRMILMSSTMAVGTLYLFSQYYDEDITKAWTVSLTTLAAFQWFNAWNCRSKNKSVFRMNPFSNKFLLGTTVLVILLQVLALYAPFLQKILRTVPLSFSEWMLIIIIASSILVVEEIRKIFYRLIKA